jgi:hypothetical protein
MDNKNSEERMKSPSEDEIEPKEPDYDEDRDQLEDKKQEEEQTSGMTINHVF